VIIIRIRFVVYVLLLVLITSAYLILDSLLAASFLKNTVLKLVYSALIFSFGIIVAEAINVVIEREVEDKKSRHIMKRVTILGILLLTLFAILSVVVENWFALAMSLGLIGFGLTYSLQQVIINFFGWITIMIAKPYLAGDRIMIGNVKGDVVDISYMSTEMWEFGGELVAEDRPSGRLVTVPNSMVLTYPIYNYTKTFPYVWSEISFALAYESDLRFVRETMTKIAYEYLGEEMEKRVKEYREILSQTPVDKLDISEKPSVRIVPKDSWVEVRLRFLVSPREIGTVKTDLTVRILEAFNSDPERVKFPVGRAR